ncbi:hypothetical protein BJ878DRAFT_238200 [Calycina marina]|uniref:Cupin type-2 domain-containing protein n=1 Tax=Calycina marina TaxID=1763456 RepID=A0A9P8CJ45_9HELO|nr:hypothetical protein BJ878DRAFT_238200 [Calycina marina]
MRTQDTVINIPPSYTSTAPTEHSNPTDLSIPRSNYTWHTLLSSPSTPKFSLCAGIAVLPAKTGILCPHRHKQAEIYYIISGSGVTTIEGVEYVLQARSTLFMPGDAEHGIRNWGGGDEQQDAFSML